MYINLDLHDLSPVNFTDVNFSIASVHHACSQLSYDRTDKNFKHKYVEETGDKTADVVTNSTPMSFDIETTNVTEYDKNGKCTKAEGYMYKWQFGIGTTIIHGRKWSEFLMLLNAIYAAHPMNKIAFNRVYIANLAFEFQYMRKRLSADGWCVNVFARENRQPMTATICKGTCFIVFQDALQISNSSLAKLCKLYNLPSKKKEGDLDYSIPRNSMTPLTAEEMDYCSFDCRTLNEFFMWIDENYIQQNHAHPLTATGLPRSDCKELFKRFETKTYKTSTGKTKKTKSSFAKKVLPELWPDEYAEYNNTIKYGFSGGFTHANALYVDRIMNDVNGGDFTSSYPYTMMFQKFPMSKFMMVDVKDINDIVKVANKYASLAIIKFKDLETTTTHSTISVSKLLENEMYGSIDLVQKACDIVADNGRVVYAGSATLMLTDVDIIENLMKFYTWSEYEIVACKQSKYGYLPDYVRYNVALSYMKKNVLKVHYKSLGLEPGDFSDYKIAKAMVNSNYGMMCEHLQTSEITYNDDAEEWGLSVDYDPSMTPEACSEYEYAEALWDDRGNFKPILSPYWGIWVTSHARGNLFKILSAIGEDALYCDTDSIYYINPDKHQDICDKYNDYIHTTNIEKVEEWNRNHGFDRAHYDTLNDDAKKSYSWQHCGLLVEHFITLGEFEKLNPLGNYTRFKTLGAKRYLKEGPELNSKTGEVETVIISTIAGLPKSALNDYCKAHNIDPFDFFKSGMKIPKVKKAHKYNDSETKAIITDNFGNTEEMTELSSLGIFDVDFTMSITGEFAALVIAYSESKERQDIYKIIKEILEHEEKKD